MSEPQTLNLPEILALHAQSVADSTTGQRASLDGARLIGASLDGARLIGANLREANLSGANLTRADLSGANLREANLSGANLTRANLTRADLGGANLREANLSGANLTRADLTGANLSGANLSGANLAWANLSGANLSRANLTGVLGLAIASDAPQRLRTAATAALQKDALEMQRWHTCETTHCLGGWLIHQAGEPGRLLEAAVGSELAGLMLGGIEAHSHFYDTTEAAAEWLRSVLERPEVAK